MLPAANFRRRLHQISRSLARAWKEVRRSWPTCHFAAWSASGDFYNRLICNWLERSPVANHTSRKQVGQGTSAELGGRFFHSSFSQELPPGDSKGALHRSVWIPLCIVPSGYPFSWGAGEGWVMNLFDFDENQTNL